MSRAKKTKRQKAYSLANRYRHITEVLNHAKKQGNDLASTNEKANTDVSNPPNPSPLIM